MDSHFPSSYEDSRARFLHEAELLRGKWPESQPGKHALKNSPDLSIDWLWTHPRRKENLVLISTAEHGIEGYVGSAMMKLFMDEFAPRLNPENTGLLLIHAINPWGMKNRCRVNPDNVDLNRNFVINGDYSPALNPDYDGLFRFLNPQRPVRTKGREVFPFLAHVLKNMIHPGRTRVQAASLLGQHRHPTGIYFGGKMVQEETTVLMALYRNALAEYRHFHQVDIHTGYGPRYQMTVLISPLDKFVSADASRRFNYPLVQKIDAHEFYAISGDMGDFIYRLRDAEFPNKKVFAGGFEFGTFGDSLPALIRSLWTTIMENQLRQHGAADRKTEQQVHREYQELFYPMETRWREKALADGRQAFEGILHAFELI